MKNSIINQNQAVTTQGDEILLQLLDMKNYIYIFFFLWGGGGYREKSKKNYLVNSEHGE